MAFTNEVLLLTREVETQSAVVSALESEERRSMVNICSDAASLVNHLECRDIAVALVDIDPQPLRVLEELEPITNRFVRTRFIVLSSELDNGLVLKAMQAGVRHVQVKKTIESELAAVLQRLMPNLSLPASHLGTALTVLSASGGCGATTLAVNLANELQIETQEPVLLVDLDYSYGAVASYLELRGQYGIADVLAHDGGIDPQLISTTAVRHSENLYALLSPASINFSSVEPLEAGTLHIALAACRQDYRFTVIDAPRVPIDVAATLAAASEVTLIVLQPTVKDLRVTKALLSALVERGISADKVKPIVNRYRKRHQMISMEDAQEVLNGLPVGRLCNDFPSAIRGINYGKPLARAAPRSSLRKDLIQLAREVSELSSNNHGRMVSRHEPR
jgi:pilus assembly protein CpaE